MNGYGLFQIPNKDNCACVIIYFEDFQSKFTTLIIRVRNPISTYPTLFIRFDGVYYIDAPTFWTGANFRIGSFDESLELWNRIGPQKPDDLVQRQAEKWPVYLVDTPRIQIKILAMSVSISDINPFAK
jgi:hypothetical protein